jgi:5,10-methylenetetrahydromethanopterin reductase
MKFALQRGGTSIQSRVAMTQRAEAAEVDLVGYGGVGTWPVMIACAAQATSRVRLSTAITEPLTHHPVMAATAAAALAEVSSGRFVLAYGTGDSIAKRLGRRPATLAHLREHVQAVRDLMAGREATVGGRRCFLSAGIVAWDPVDVPIYMAASGPRALALAAEIADGVIVNVGLAPGALAAARRTIEATQPAHRPDGGPRELWCFTIAVAHQDRREAIRRAKGIVASSAHMAFQATVEGKDVPPELEGAVQEFVRRYDVAYHGSPGQTPNVDVMDQLGLTEWLLDRFAVVGDATACRAQIARLRDAGVSRTCGSRRTGSRIRSTSGGRTSCRSSPQPTR